MYFSAAFLSSPLQLLLVPPPELVHLSSGPRANTAGEGGVESALHLVKHRPKGGTVSWDLLTLNYNIATVLQLAPALYRAHRLQYENPSLPLHTVLPATVVTLLLVFIHLTTGQDCQCQHRVSPSPFFSSLSLIVHSLHLQPPARPRPTPPHRLTLTLQYTLKQTLCVRNCVCVQF